MNSTSSPVKKSLSKWLCNCLSSKKKNEPDQAGSIDRRRQLNTRPTSAQPNRSRDRSVSTTPFDTTTRRHITVPQPRVSVQETLKLLNIQSVKQKLDVKVS